MLELINIVKTYGKHKILDRLNLKIEGPTLLGISGLSGEGKSTLLHLMGGLDKDYQGEIKFNHTNIQIHLDQYRQRYVGFVFQSHLLLSKWTVQDNLLLTDYLLHKKHSEMASYYMDVLGLEPMKKKKGGWLSGGQQQRYSLVRALLKEPQILLCDEPTSALDKENAKKVMALLKEYAKDHIVIVVSHDRYMLQTYCKEVVDLREGKLSKECIKSQGCLKEQKEVKKRKVFYDYMRLLRISFKNQKERNLLSLFTLTFATLCLLLTLIVSINLKSETLQQFKRLFPTQCISLKPIDRSMLEEGKVEELVNYSTNIEGGYLNVPYIEFNGISDHIENQTLYIGDNTRIIRDSDVLLMGRQIENEHEIMVSKNTFERLFNESFNDQSVYGEYVYQGQTKRASFQIVGIVDEFTSMDTIYRRQGDEWKVMKQCFSLDKIDGDYLMLYCQGDVQELKKELESAFTQYEFKVVGESFVEDLKSVIDKIQVALLVLTCIVFIVIFLLLGVSVYLNIVERMKEIGMFRMLGATHQQIILLQFMDVGVLSVLGSVMAILFVNNGVLVINQAMAQLLGFEMKLQLSPMYIMIVFFVINGLGAMSAWFPIKKLSRISLVDCLKQTGL